MDILCYSLNTIYLGRLFQSYITYESTNSCWQPIFACQVLSSLTRGFCNSSISSDNMERSQIRDAGAEKKNRGGDGPLKWIPIWCHFLTVRIERSKGLDSPLGIKLLWWGGWGGASERNREKQILMGADLTNHSNKLIPRDFSISSLSLKSYYAKVLV